MKAIFLDFDGVITTEASLWNLSLEKMQLVKRIVDATDAKVVISSSWRRHTLEQTIESITTGNPFVNEVPFLMPEYVVGITARMYAFKHGTAEKHFSVCRGIEIQQYLDEHRDIENYVILDDDPDMLLSQSQKFIQTDAREGVSEKDVERAIEILNCISANKEIGDGNEKSVEQMEETMCNNCPELCSYHLYVYDRGHDRDMYKEQRCDRLIELINNNRKEKPNNE